MLVPKVLREEDLKTYSKIRKNKNRKENKTVRNGIKMLQ